MACARDPATTRTRTSASIASSARSPGSSATWPVGRRRTSPRPGVGDALAGLSLGRTFRGLGRADARTLTRVLPMAVADFVAESFETDAAAGGHRLARRAVHRDGPVVRRARPRSCWGTRPATTAERPARRSSPAAGPARWPRRSPRPPRRPAWRSGPTPRSIAITSHDGRATGVVLASGDELEAKVVVSGLDPKQTLTRLADPGRRRAEPALAGRQHPDARHGRQGQPRPVGAARLPGRGRGRRGRHGRPARPDRHGARHRCDGAGPRCRQVRSPPGRADDGGDDPVARRSGAGRRRARGHATS